MIRAADPRKWEEAHSVLGICRFYPRRQCFSSFNQDKFTVRVVSATSGDDLSSGCLPIKKTDLMATSHLELISLSNHTASHSSSTQSPTLILPSNIHFVGSSGFATSLTSNESRCHIKSRSFSSTTLVMHAARLVEKALSERSVGGYIV